MYPKPKLMLSSISSLHVTHPVALEQLSASRNHSRLNSEKPELPASNAAIHDPCLQRGLTSPKIGSRKKLPQFACNVSCYSEFISVSLCASLSAFETSAAGPLLFVHRSNLNQWLS